MEYYRLGDASITDKLVGQTIGITAVVRSKDIRTQRDGGRFLNLTLGDRGTRLETKIWSATDELAASIISGAAYDFIVEVKPWRGSKSGISCIVTSFSASAADPAQFENWAPNVDHVVNDFTQLLASLEGSIYHSVVSNILHTNWNLFARWPAGKSNHHPELGGLLWHTTSVAKTAIRIGDGYNQVYGDGFINIQLLTAGALLHDIGKTREIELDNQSNEADYSINSAFTTHVIDSILLVDREATKLGIIDREEIKLLEHIIASHHGKLEWGSPIKPSVPEAYILHVADELDAELWKYNKAFSNLSPGQREAKWIGSEIVQRYKERGKV